MYVVVDKEGRCPLPVFTWSSKDGRIMKWYKGNAFVPPEGMRPDQLDELLANGYLRKL